MCDKQRLRPACAYAQSDQSLCLSLEYSQSVKLLTEHHLEFLSLKGGCAGLSESTHVKMPLVVNHMSWLNYISKTLCKLTRDSLLIMHLASFCSGGKLCSLQFGMNNCIDFSLTVKAAPHECVIRTGQP